MLADCPRLRGHQELHGGIPGGLAVSAAKCRRSGKRGSHRSGHLLPTLRAGHPAPLWADRRRVRGNGRLRIRHAIDDEIAILIGHPPTSGHIGEVVAAAIFDVELAASGVNAGFDGHFRSGPLAGQTVNVKAYAERTSLLDISPHPCDSYLVIMGPQRTSADSGRSLPFRIERVYLFDIEMLKASLKAAGVGIGVAWPIRTGGRPSRRAPPRRPDPGNDEARRHRAAGVGAAPVVGGAAVDACRAGGRFA